MPNLSLIPLGAFAFSAPEPGLTYECSLDAAAFSPCASPKSYSDLPLGEHTFRVRVFSPDAVEETPPAEWTGTVVDSTAPDTTIGFGPPAVTASDVANFDFTTEPGATFECSLDNAPFASCEAPLQLTGLGLGEHNLRVRAVDASGNSDPTPASHGWRVVQPPDTRIVSGPEGEITTSSASFRFASTQASSTFECSLDGGPFLVCPAEHQLSGLADGDHMLWVRARSEFGVTDPEPALWEWTVDATAPETTIASGPESPTVSTTASFTFSASEAGAGFECSLDGAAFADCPEPSVFSGLAVGLHELRVRAVDGSGNVDPTAAGYSWTIVAPDTTAPETQLNTRPDAATQSASASFTFAAGEPGSTFRCSLDGAGFEPCGSPQSYSGLAAGEHEFRVHATDPAGNTGATPASYSWTVDQTAPSTAVGSAPPATTSSAAAEFGFSASEPGVTFECSLDGAAWAACSSPRALSGLATGSHTFRVRATDAAGNVEATPESHTWTVVAADSRAPETTIDTKPAATTRSTDAAFTFSSDEAGSSFECSLDGAQFAGCSSPRAHTGLAGGSHEFRVRAVDAAGNSDATPASHSWTVDVSAPETTIDTKPVASTTSTAASFGFSSNEAGSSFECALDSGPFTPCTSPKAYSGLAVGARQFRVRATDGVGNVDATPASYSWTITQACNGSTVTLGAAADGWILQSSAGQNYGTDSGLKVDTKSGANARAVFRFNFPAIPAGCQVTSAKLRLYATSYKTGRTLMASQLASTWTETGVNWTNQPQTTGTAATVASGSGYREWTVTSHVQAMYAPGANHGFMIRDAGENGTGLDQVFHSREKGTDNPPRLVITFGS